MSFFTLPASSALWLSFLSLTCLEIILGIDNLIFISIAISRLPQESQKKARYLGLALALVLRLALLYAALWLVSFTQPLFSFNNLFFSIRDLFMLMGGLFLIVKATNEIHIGIAQVNSRPKNPSFRRFGFVILQIILLDLIFSFDSIMTAIGLTQNFLVMSAAISISILLMLLASDPLHAFINKYNSIKVLALSFLMLIGMSLIASGMHFNIPHGYIYFAMIFSLIVEILNIVTGRQKS